MYALTSDSQKSGTIGESHTAMYQRDYLRPLQHRHIRRTRQSRTRLVWAVIAVALVAWVGTRGLRHPSPAVQTLGDIPSVQAEVVEKVFRVGLQVGHLDAAGVPEELEKISWNFGASAGGVNERDINQDTVDRVAVLLRAQGIEVDILSATVPPSYQADAFISFHADGNEDTTVSGFKVVASEWDVDGRATRLAAFIETAYGEAMKMEVDTAVSPDMLQYYAFNHTKFTHAIDPSTPGLIIELGFITNASDRRKLTTQGNVMAQAIAGAILEYRGLQE